MEYLIGLHYMPSTGDLPDWYGFAEPYELITANSEEDAIEIFSQKHGWTYYPCGIMCYAHKNSKGWEVWNINKYASCDLCMLALKYIELKEINNEREYNN